MNSASRPSAVGPPPRAVEQRGDVVDADDRAAAAGRGEGGVAAAGRDVEDALGRVDVERLDQQLGTITICVPIMW